MGAWNRDTRPPNGYLQPVIYYIGTGEHVKIGFTNTLEGVMKRLSAMQTGNPWTLVVLLVIPGDMEREADLHYQHEDQWVRGEWFKSEGPLSWTQFDTPPAHLLTVEDA